MSSRRAIVTENAADFLAIAKQRSAVGDVAPSLLITSNRAFPRHTPSFIGPAIRALAVFADERSDEDIQAGAVHWLPPIGWRQARNQLAPVISRLAAAPLGA